MQVGASLVVEYVPNIRYYCCSLLPPSPLHFVSLTPLLSIPAGQLKQSSLLGSAMEPGGQAPIIRVSIR